MLMDNGQTGGEQMAEELTTNEKKCPKCGSLNVQYQGLGHAPGVGDRIAKNYKYQFKCQACEVVFWYIGEFP